MKPNDSRERLKALMRTTAANSIAAPQTPVLATATANPPSVAITETPATRTATVQNGNRANWNRVTIRLPAGELAKINDVVIATQQATRSSKVTTTDILRVALRRIKDQEAISAAEISVLRTRFVKGKTV